MTINPLRALICREFILPKQPLRRLQQLTFNAIHSKKRFTSEKLYKFPSDAKIRILRYIRINITSFSFIPSRGINFRRNGSPMLNV